jgi:hypothetical protein
VQAAYVGSRGINLYTSRTLNQINPATGRRPRTDIGEIIYRENSARSSYHALQLSVNKKLSHGLTADVYYTFAKAMAYGGADSTLTRDTTVQDYSNVAGSYGPKLGDVRHRFVAVHSYQTPMPQFIKNSSFANALLGGWAAQGIINWRSGLPINVTAGRDLIGNGITVGTRPDLVAGVDPYRKNADALTWLNPAAFDVATPAAQRRFGTLGFNAFYGPSGFSYDAALHKTFTLAERHRINFRFELFNALNHKILGNPDSNRSSPNFGKILSASGGRNIQFALKYTF